MNRLFTLVALISIILSNTVISQSINNGLLVHYNFDNNVADQTGNGHDAVNSGATFTTDRDGNTNGAIFFDGVDNYLVFPNDIELKQDLPVSFSFWVKPESLLLADNKFFYTEANYNNYTGFFMTTTSDDSGKLTLAFGGNVGTASSNNRRSYTSDNALTAGNWHHIVAIIRSYNDMDIYIDCNQQNGSYSGSGPTDVVHVNSTGLIGSAPSNSNNPQTYGNLTMDDFAMWNRALTVNEITELCNESIALSVNDEKNISKINCEVYPNPTSNSTTFEVMTQEENLLKI